MTRQDQAPRRMAAAKPNTFFGGAAILAMGILVVKVIGLFYKIPLVNIIGSEASGSSISTAASSTPTTSTQCC